MTHVVPAAARIRSATHAQPRIHARSTRMSALVSTRDLTKTYQRGPERIEVLHGVNIDIQRGDFVHDDLPLHVGGDAALILRHANPLNPARDVVVWTDHLPLCPKELEALPWTLPQYVAFDPRLPCRRTSHPDWSAFDARLAEEGIAADDVPIENQPLRYLPDCFLGAGYL